MASIRKLPGHVPPKPRRSPSWGRIALVLLALVTALYAWAWWRATQAVDAELARWSPLVDLERGVVVLGPTGRIGVRELVVRATGAPRDGARVRIGNAIVDVGAGPRLFGRLLAGEFGPASGSFRLILRRVVMEPGAGAAPLGLVDRWVLFPFDLAGCGGGAGASLAALPGLSGTAVDAELAIDRRDDSADVRLRATSHAIADLAIELKLDAVGRGSWFSALQGARLRGARLEIVDHGFAAVRNRHCAATLGVAEPAAIDRHVAGVRDWFAARHAEPAAPLLAVYRRLAERGGTLEANFRPRRPLPLVEFADMPLRDFSVHFGGTARVEGLVPATLALSPLLIPDRAPVPAAAVDAPLVALSAAAEVAGARPGAPPPPALRFRVGQTLEYTDLESLVGAGLAVTSTLGVTRRGRLVRYTRAGIEVELDAGDGGFRLSMPRDTIRSVVLLSNPPLDAAPTGRN
jgi:hypothetical protein